MRNAYEIKQGNGISAKEYDFSALLGAYGDGDTIAISVDFKKADASKATASYKSGAQTSDKEMIEFTDSSTVTDLTKVVVTLTFRRTEGTDIDGYIDELSLVLQ